MPAQALPSLSTTAAVQRLAAGGLVVHATMSLLGIGADPTQPSAITKLDTLKGRAPGSGYVHVVDCAAHAEGWVAGDSWQHWLRPTLPAPITWVFPAGPLAPKASCGPNQTIAIRLDSHPCVAALCDGMGRPFVSTSLNAAGKPPIEDVARVPPTLAAQLAGVYLMAPPPLGLPSTVVLISTDGWSVLRHGAVSEDALRAALAANP